MPRKSFKSYIIFTNNSTLPSSYPKQQLLQIFNLLNASSLLNVLFFQFTIIIYLEFKILLPGLTENNSIGILDLSKNRLGESFAGIYIG